MTPDQKARTVQALEETYGLLKKKPEDAFLKGHVVRLENALLTNEFDTSDFGAN